MNTAEDMHNYVLLQELIRGLVELPGDPAASVSRPLSGLKVRGVKMDSRQVQDGDLFLACLGRSHDAREFIPHAVKAGAVAVLAESSPRWQGISHHGAVPVIAVDKLSAKLSEIAGRFYRFPSHAVKVIGITGTNGKTSCSQFLAQALTRLGCPCGVLGTLGYGPVESHGQSGQAVELRETQLTTPDAVFTQMALAQMREARMRAVAMEVSSVGLHQHRVRAVRFDTAVFTNLSRDHLDYHVTMECYAENKRRLFTMDALQSAVVNLDDPYSLHMIDAVAAGVDIHTYSIENPAAEVHASKLLLHPGGYTATVHTPLGSGDLQGRLLGRFNFSNLLGVLASLISYFSRHGSSGAGDRPTPALGEILEAVSDLSPVQGRMQIIGEGDDITAVVDYAHTPDGLRCALTALREHFSGRIWCVFGCGGNRDQGKRPLMGEIAEKYGDALVIADDNPRNEEGDLIVQHILSGIGDRSRVTVLRDRAVAIEFAITAAEPGDVVLVAGKGHENYQDIGGNHLLFSDAGQVRLALQKRARRSRSH